MSQQLWSAVDAYIGEHLIGEDPALEETLRESARAGLPPIAVSPAHGQMLGLLARLQRPRRILEVGTLGGYSTIWLARALGPDGRLVTLELDARYAELAAANVAHAGLEERVEICVGPAAQTLSAMVEQDVEPFEMVFIDADKKSTPEYFQAALALSRAGALIVVDNVVRAGALIDPDTADEGAQGMRRFHEMLAGEPGLSATTIQTVGVKGHDGFTLVLRGSEAADG